jgi:hypothetical protein
MALVLTGFRESLLLSLLFSPLAIELSIADRSPSGPTGARGTLHELPDLRAVKRPCRKRNRRQLYFLTLKTVPQPEPQPNIPPDRVVLYR